MRFLQSQRRSPGRSAFWTIFWWSFIRTCLRIAFTLVYRLRIVGAERVPAEGPLIYISNHQSHFDPVIIGILVGDRPFASMARASLFDNAVLGPLIRTLSAVPVKPGAADRASIKTLLGELEAGRSVLLFPEGKRTNDGRIDEFRRGVSLLIKRSGATLVPVALEGAFDVWPRGRSLPRLRGRIAVMVGQPMSAESLHTDDAEAMLDGLRRQIESMRMDLRNQIRHRTNGRWPKPGPADAPSVEDDDRDPTTAAD